jgi:hypothetical protein
MNKRDQLMKLAGEIAESQKSFKALKDELAREEFARDPWAAALLKHILNATVAKDYRKVSELGLKLHLYAKRTIVAEQKSMHDKVVEETSAHRSIPIPERYGLNAHLVAGIPSFVGGFAGKGKTTFAVNLAWDMLAQGKRILFVSLEMSEPMILNRLLAVDRFMERGESLGWHEARLLLSGGEGKDYLDTIEPRLHIKQRNGSREITGREPMTAADVLNYAEWYSVRHGEPDVVVIDYAQIIDDPITDGGRNPLCKTLRTLTDGIKGTGAAWVVLAQDNRESYKAAKNRAPDMTAFAGSPQFERDGGLLVTIGREHGKAFDITELRVCKNRFGPVGSSFLIMDNASGSYGRKTSLEEIKQWRSSSTNESPSESEK